MMSCCDDPGHALCGWCNSPRGLGHGLICGLKTCAILLFLLGFLTLIGVARTLDGDTLFGLDNDALWHLATILFILGVGCKIKLVMLKQKLMLMMLMDDGCDEDHHGGGDAAEHCGEGGCAGGSCSGGECGDGQCCKGLPDDQCCQKK